MPDDMLQTHGLDQMQTERIELALQDALKNAQQGDHKAYLLATLAQSNIYLVERTRHLELAVAALKDRVSELEGK
ncbi:hypothetical protein [Halomonas stenophila]|uniref:Uncharacterized protein n=1 Tax=Halomonas stenophila TaxID=795312 RepID=A0A7W5ET82_9GAMM|nr:hypothetical protein [Halomonas stenophila]MBB3231063.1 hypothetical protein [Halomonas stenophila]